MSWPVRPIVGWSAEVSTKPRPKTIAHPRARRRRLSSPPEGTPELLMRVRDQAPSRTEIGGRIACCDIAEVDDCRDRLIFDEDVERVEIAVQPDRRTAMNRRIHRVPK